MFKKLFGNKDAGPIRIGAPAAPAPAAAPEAVEPVEVAAVIETAQVLPLRAVPMAVAPAAAPIKAVLVPPAAAAAPAVAPVSIAPAQAPAAAQAAQVKQQARPLEEHGIITSNSQVGKFTRILTADLGSRQYRLPKHLELAVMILEVGPKRATIFYNPSAPNRDVSEALSNLRKELTIEGYEVEKQARCSEAVMKALLEDYRKSSAYTADSGGSSAAKSLWESWQDIAWQEHASDLHIQILNNQASVMIRVDGTLEPLPDAHDGIYTKTQAEQAIVWAYSDASTSDSNNAAMFSPKNNIYSMFKPRVIDGSKVGMRFQSLIGAYGPKVICRLLNIDTEAETLTYDQLGYADSHKGLLKEASENPTGLVLFTGVTGSGKTTAQKTYIETHPDNGSAAFYSIEDPIEYPLRNVHQIPIQRDLSNPEQSQKLFNEIVSGVMRADPDGLLVGEIRDTATAGTAQQIVETGHFALATLHAHLISGIVPRLTDKSIGMSREVITGPNILNLLVYQGLVPVLCRECCINGANDSDFEAIHYGKITSQAQHDIAINGTFELLDLLEKKFGIPRDLFNFRKNQGCPHCKKRGTKGLTVVAEMLMPDDKWLELTRNKKDHEAVAHYRSFSDRNFLSPNMTGKTVFEHALYKATQGIVDPRRCQNFDTFRRFKILENETT